MAEWYKEDLAYIHDVGHSDYALQSAPGIIDSLAKHGITDGLVVDLGCGSGWSAAELVKANYQVMGIDLSEALVAIARNRVPSAQFLVVSFFKAPLPPCQAVIAVSECLNYLFDPDNTRQHLAQLFSRIYEALEPGGLLIFDIAEPGQVPRGSPVRSFKEGSDWFVLVEKEEDPIRATLTRRIVTFRQVGDHYRRSDEVHQLQLYSATEIAPILFRMGFQVQIMRRYGAYELPKAHAAFVARKPTH